MHAGRVRSTIRAAFSDGDMRAYRSKRTASASGVVSAGRAVWGTPQYAARVASRPRLGVSQGPLSVWPVAEPSAAVRRTNVSRIRISERNEAKRLELCYEGLKSPLGVGAS